MVKKELVSQIVLEKSWKLYDWVAWLWAFWCKYEENFYAPFPQLQIKFNWIVTNPTILAG